MTKNKQKNIFTSMSINEIADYFDTHDMGDYWEQMPEANFDINIKKRTHLIAIDEEIIYKLSEIASSKQVSMESLINSWLKEKIATTT